MNAPQKSESPLAGGQFAKQNTESDHSVGDEAEECKFAELQERAKAAGIEAFTALLTRRGARV